MNLLLFLPLLATAVLTEGADSSVQDTWTETVAEFMADPVEFVVKRRKMELRIKAAIEALACMRDADGNPITVTVTGTFAAQGQSGVTIAFTSDNALDPDKHVTFTNLAGNAVHQATSVRTVQGTEGWISGGLSSFEVTIYAMMYKKVRSKHGHISITEVYNT